MAHLDEARKPNGEEAVADVLERENKLERVGGLSFLSAIATEAALTDAVPELASIVKRAYMDREVSRELSGVLQLIKGGTPAEDLLGALAVNLEGIQRSNARERLTVSQGVHRQLQNILQPAPGEEPLSPLRLPWELGRFVPGGLPLDKVTVVFGASGGLKTTITNALIRHLAQQLKPGEVAVKFGLEDNALLEYQRLIAVLADVPLADVIERRIDAAKLARLERFNAEWLTRLVILDNVPMIPEELIRLYRAETAKVRFVTYDYVQMMDWHSDGERATLHKSMLKFQRAANRDRVAQIVVSQIDENKVVPHDQRGRPQNCRPRMKHLFGSATIKNASKLALGIYRPYAYFPGGPPKKTLDEEIYGEQYTTLEPEAAKAWWKSLVEVIVRKNVLGEVDQSCRVLVDLPKGAVEKM